LLSHPGQHSIDGYLVADANVALNLVDFIAVSVDAVPALKTLGFKIGLNLSLFGRLAVTRGLGKGGHGRLRGHGRSRGAGWRVLKGRAVGAAGRHRRFTPVLASHMAISLAENPDPQLAEVQLSIVPMSASGS